MIRHNTLIGASAARIFACSIGPRIALEAPDMAGLVRLVETGQTETKTVLEAAGEKLGTIETKTGELGTRLSEIEQRLARPGILKGGLSETKSLGQEMVESEQFKTLAASPSQRGTARIELKAMLSNSSTWGGTASVSNSLVVADRQPMVELPKRQLVVRDLLTVGQTVSNAVEYPQQTGFTNNAAVVAEGATKPYSTITTDLKSAPVRTIAHMFKASRQILDDAPALQSMINSQGIYGLQLAEEAEVLNGDGTGQHLLGLIPQATAYSAAFAVTGETAIDRIALALGQAEMALVPATGVLLHPLDWLKIRIIKDGMGRYLLGDPQTVIARNIWNVPVATSMSVTFGSFLVGAFRDAVTLFERMAVEVLVSTENADDFEKNLVSIRIEERVALAVYRPQGFITGQLP